MPELFTEGVRDDWTPARANEGMFPFLDRSATPFFSEVRRLLTEWVSHLPPDARAQLVGGLQSADEHSFNAAFWELYLHESYTRSGHSVRVHPDVPEAGTHPDFLVDGEYGHFYLEAVCVGVNKDDVAEDRRLKAVEAVLESVTADQFIVMLSAYRVGPGSLPTQPLRKEVRRWLADLDPAAVVAGVIPGAGFSSLPALTWERDGWWLEFHAFPLTQGATGKNLRLLGGTGPGEAEVVDNVTGIQRVLDAKANKYGALDAPLVIAVLSNTTIPTRDYEIEQALFGISAHRPPLSADNIERLFADGHWLTRRGWRRGHAPQVVAAHGLSPWWITKVRPSLWSTLEAGVGGPIQPGWLGRVDVSGPEAVVVAGSGLEEHFGLPAGWLDHDPEFRSP